MTKRVPNLPYLWNWTSVSESQLSGGRSYYHAFV